MFFVDLYQLIVIFGCATLVSLAPIDDSKDATILKYEYTHENPGNYYFEYLTSDGQSREEKGEFDSESANPDFVVKGSYSFTGADGVVYTVHYTADKDGFHPEGDHIKVPPYTPWPTNLNLGEDDGQYNPIHDYPETKYLPSTKSPKVPDDTTDSPTILKKNVMISSTPTPPNAYIPSSPSPKMSDVYSQLVSQTYVPSTVTPSINSVTVSPLNHIASGSTPVPKITAAKGFSKSNSNLFEVIQNNHSSGGVFKESS